MTVWSEITAMPWTKILDNSFCLIQPNLYFVLTCDPTAVFISLGRGEKKERGGGGDLMMKMVMSAQAYNVIRA